jgi:hypothetical protein
LKAYKKDEKYENFEIRKNITGYDNKFDGKNKTTSK